MIIDLAKITLVGIDLAGIRIPILMGHQPHGAEFLDTDFNDDYRIEATM